MVPARFMFLYILLTGILYISAQNSSITFLPDLLRCIGDEVEMICYVNSSSLQFIDSAANIALNGSALVTLSAFNTVTSTNGIDTSRYTASITDLSISISRPGVRVIISDYQASDGLVVFGCGGALSGGIVSDILIQGQPQRLASPPSPPVSLTADFNSITCSGTVQLAWTPGATDRDIQMYFLYQNGNEIASLGSVTSYSHPTTLQRDMTYTYSVVAMSCAGNSTHTNADPISVGNPPSSPVVTLSQTDNSCSNLIISWSTPDKSRATYSVYRNATFLTNTTSNQYTDSTQLAISTVYEYSVVAISCAGNSTQGTNTGSIGYRLSTNDLSSIYDETDVYIDWDLSPNSISQNILISYSLEVKYIYSIMDISIETSNNMFNFSQLSNDTDIHISNLLEPPNLDNYTEIQVCIRITQQCGKPIPGSEIVCGDLSSVSVSLGPYVTYVVLVVFVIIVVCCFCAVLLIVLIISSILCFYLKKKKKGYFSFGGRKRLNSQEMNEQKKTEESASEKQMQGNYAEIDHITPKPYTIKRHEPIEETNYTTVQQAVSMHLTDRVI